jgi:hypothetical protein
MVQGSGNRVGRDLVAYSTAARRPLTFSRRRQQQQMRATFPKSLDMTLVSAKLSLLSFIFSHSFFSFIFFQFFVDLSFPAV